MLAKQDPVPGCFTKIWSRIWVLLLSQEFLIIKNVWNYLIWTNLDFIQLFLY